MKTCEECEKDLEGIRPRNPRRKFCSPKCARISYIKMYAGNNPIKGISAGTVGAVNELVVSIDLLRKGFAVFRAISPCCPVDLAVLIDGKLIKIEVTTGYVTPKGKLVFPRHHGGHDVMAVVVGESEIHYLPPLTLPPSYARPPDPSTWDSAGWAR